MKKNLKVVAFYLVIIIAMISITTWMIGSTDDTKPKYSEIKEYFYNEQVKSFEIDNNNVIILRLHGDEAEKTDSTEGTTTNETPAEQVEYKLRSLDWFMMEMSDTIEEQHKAGIIEEYDFEEPVEVAWWVSFLPYIIVLVFVVIIYFVSINQAMGGGKGGKINSFGRSRAHLINDSKNKVRFSDVAGADEEKEELKEVVEFLKSPTRFNELGARIPRGVLLVGPPGTGKTLLAKAVAGEAGVPFYSISGSDFVEMYVGVGASRVRDLFENAKKNAPSIIFIDEIDAVGRHRGAGLGGGHDEREQTLNQLLVEMDGFGSNEGVIVIAATNRPDILDPALLRPGRFDRQVTVNYPDLKGRFDILKVHAKGKPFEGTVDLEKIAQATVGFTGADLANLLNEAALHAARKHKKLIGMKDIEEAYLKIMVGTQKKTLKMSEEELKLTAYHEAGHAVLAHVLPAVDPVRHITIIPTGKALGFTFTPPVKDRVSVYKKGLMQEITMTLGGRVAEKTFFDDITGGASGDIQHATSIARSMITRYGMSDKLGPIAFASERSNDEVFLGRDFNNTKNYSEETASLIDSEIKRIMDECFAEAERLISENAEKIHATAQYLLKYETMDDAEFKFLMDTTPTPSIEEIAAIAEAKKKQSESENEQMRQQVFTVKKDDDSDDSDDYDNSGISNSEAQQHKDGFFMFPFGFGYISSEEPKDSDNKKDDRDDGDDDGGNDGNIPH